DPSGKGDVATELFLGPGSFGTTLMKRLIACAALTLAACSQAELRPSASPIPKIAEDFQLIDQNRTAFQLRYFQDAPAIVLVSYAAGDQASEGSAKAIAALQAQYGPRGVIFALIDPASGASYASAAADAKAGGFESVRVLLDE